MKLKDVLYTVAWITLISFLALAMAIISYDMYNGVIRGLVILHGICISAIASLASIIKRK